jgi:hypothetical protein
MRALVTIVVLVVVVGRAAHADDADTGDDDGEIIDLGPGHAIVAPAIADVLAAAYRTAGLDRSSAGSWTRRSRLAGLMPYLTVRTGRDTTWDDDGSNGVGHSQVVDVRATWRLDRLVFDGHELQVATIEAARRRERRRLASRVIRAYFAWRRAALRVPAATSPGESAWRGARADEAVAELDALTDGWFSAGLVRLR